MKPVNPGLRTRLAVVGLVSVVMAACSGAAATPGPILASPTANSSQKDAVWTAPPTCPLETPDPAGTMAPAMELTYRPVDVTGNPATVTASQAETLLAILRNRLDAVGLTAVRLTSSPSNTGSGTLISVVLPAAPGALRQTVESLVGSAGALEIVLLPPADYGVLGSTGPRSLPDPGEVLDPSLSAVFTGSQIESASPRATQNTDCTWAVTVTLGGSFGAQLVTWSSSHVGNYLAIALDRRVVTVTSILNPMVAGKIWIDGRFSGPSARAFVAILKSGALPWPLQEVSALPVAG